MIIAPEVGNDLLKNGRVLVAFHRLYDILLFIKKYKGGVAQHAVRDFGGGAGEVDVYS